MYTREYIGGFAASIFSVYTAVGITAVSHEWPRMFVNGWVLSTGSLIDRPHHTDVQWHIIFIDSFVRGSMITGEVHVYNAKTELILARIELKRRSKYRTVLTYGILDLCPRDRRCNYGTLSNAWLVIRRRRWKRFHLLPFRVLSVPCGLGSVVE